MGARTIDDIDVADGVAFAPRQRWQEPMKSVKAWQTEKYVAAKSLQAAPSIPSAIAKHRAAHRICYARLELLEPGRLAADALPGDKSGAGHACLKGADQRGDECRIVLSVSVKRHNDGSARSGNTGAHCG